MTIGVVMSSILGGLAGILLTLAADFGLLQTLFAYQIGGVLAALAFLSIALPDRLSMRAPAP